MSEFSLIFAETCAEDYVRPGKEIEQLLPACRDDAWQFLTHEELHIPISEDGGFDYPDFLLAGYGYIPLVSQSMADVLEEGGVGPYDAWRQRIWLTDFRGKAEPYVLLLPMAIRALDIEKSDVRTEEEGGEVFHIVRPGGIVIDPRQVGRLQMFRLQDAGTNAIIITRRLREILEAAELENVCFSSLKDA